MKTEKTAVIWESPEGVGFYVVEGTHTHLEGVIVGYTDNKDLELEVSNLVLDYPDCTTEDFRLAIVNGASLVRCGYDL